MTVTVFLVTDQECMRKQLRELLDHQGECHIDGEAGDLTEAINHLTVHEPAIAVVDMTGSPKEGNRITRAMLACHPSLKVIGLSDGVDKRCVVDMLRAGMSGIVMREYMSEDLMRAIRQVTKHRNYLSAGITGVLVDEYIHSQDSTGADNEKP